MALVECPESLICVDNSRNLSAFSLDFFGDRVQVRASCNGLLCCSSVHNQGVYYVSNPMTGQFTLLPNCWNRRASRFYPDCNAALVGLACDLSKQKYKVVLATYHRSFGGRPGNTLICSVFDSESSKWRRFRSLQEYHLTHTKRNKVVFVNGKLHWLKNSFYILALDLDSNIWRRISLPDGGRNRSRSRAYLLEFNGWLSVIQIFEAWMKIWVLEYESEVWHEVGGMTFPLSRGIMRFSFPICLTDEYLFLATFKKVVLYHLKTGVCEEAYSVNNSTTPPLCFSAHAFQSTFFPL